MSTVLWFFLPPLILLGFVTSYTDIIYGKIKNKWIVYVLIYGILVYLGFFLYYFFNDSSLELVLLIAEEKENYSFFAQTIYNFLFTCVIGILIWLSNIWSAADTKLYIAFSFLTPVNVYTAEYIRFFPGIIIIINATIVVLGFLMFTTLKRDFKKLKESFYNLLNNPREIIFNIQIVFLIEWFMKELLSFINIKQTTIFFIFGLLIFVIFFARYLRNLATNSNLIIISLIIVRLIFDFGYVSSMSFFKTFPIIVGVFILLRLFLEDISDKILCKKVPVESLEPGMITDHFLIDTGEKIIARKPHDEKVPGKNFVVPSVEGFTKEEINKIEKARRENRLGFKYLEVATKVPFAPFLFLSVILTLLLDGSILTFIWAVF